MKKAILVFLLAVPMFGNAQEIRLETTDASVSFNYISEKTEGTVSDVTANVIINSEAIEEWTLSGTAKVQSLSTGNKMRDKHLKSKSFFHVDEYPNMTFSSTTIEKDGDNYKATGTMTIKNHTKEVVFYIKKVGNNLVCSTTIYALDYDVAIKDDRAKSKITLAVTIPLN